MSIEQTPFNSRNPSNTKRLRNFLLVPQILRLAWADARDYLTRLFIRASWKRQGLLIFPAARLYYESRSQIKIHGRCSIGNFSVLLVGESQNPVGFPLLEIGNHVHIGEQTNIRACGGFIKIGSNVLIANQVTMVSANHGTKLGKLMIDQEIKRGDILIEDDVWIGAGAVILPGAIVRKGAVIAAGAVVRGEVPSNTIFGGIPAKKISERI